MLIKVSVELIVLVLIIGFEINLLLLNIVYVCVLMFLKYLVFKYRIGFGRVIFL